MSATDPFIDVVIAVHDPRRRIDRAVASVLAASPSTDARVTVVAHGISAESLSDALVSFAGEARLRVVEFADGLYSPAGPFNHGLGIATGTYVAIMGSDDFLESGALDAWSEHVRSHRTDYLIARLRDQAGALWRDPLTRPFRGARLDPVRDRLNYRAAPLGLIRRSYLEGTGIALTTGFTSGEDIELGLALLNGQARIDVGQHLPCYVIGQDAPQRVTLLTRSPAAEFEALLHLSEQSWPLSLPRRRRRAIAIKLWRMNVIPAVLLRQQASDWTPDDLDALRRVAEWLHRLDESAVRSLSRSEHLVVAAATAPDADGVALAIARVRGAGPADRLRTVRLRDAFAIDSLLRRVVRLRLPH
ncbi:glycosyltransferase family 2 protein [Leifsonia flava]|uniref:glycosyltransferase family 2 protein n=1 Tax=Orlajensenia leifsoniae TaxID=2561933 RepID=UPI0014322979|nr:glycosyltransferase family 2 protein [Leifsonia flava]